MPSISLQKNLFCLLFVILLSSCSSSSERLQEITISGRTMGTTYHIKVVSSSSMDVTRLQKEVDQRLIEINQSMSTYLPDSEISRFNVFEKEKEPFSISADFLKVMLQAEQLYKLSEGAWDGTLIPLIRLWGFGGAQPLQQLPPEDMIAEAKTHVGFDLITIHPDGHLIKRKASVQIDLASIAKGFGVDQISVRLGSLGYANHLVEIGGEVFATGRRLDGQPWRVGINRPRAEATATEVYKVVALQDQAMATSGDYRNFQIIEGRTYSHIVDPRSGYPVQNGVVSASVIADNCTFADGLATALMVMGPQKAMALLNRLPGVEGLVVVRTPDNSLHNYYSNGMARFTQSD